MSEERKFPSQLQVVRETEAGQVLEAVAEPSLTEQKLDYLEKHLLRGAEVLNMEPQSWKVPDWLPSNALIAVYAAPGVGKSFYALTLALEIARGGSWLGTPLEAEKVLYVAAEKATTLRDRAEAWCEHYGATLPDNFLLEQAPRPPLLSDLLMVQALCTLIERTECKFVILDTYAMMLQGIDENSSKDSGIPIDALSQLRVATKGGSVLVVHHSGKDSSKGLRGSSALLGAVDLAIEIANTGQGRLQATVRKSNAGSEPMPEHYLLNTQPVSGNRSSAVLISTGAPVANPELEAKALEVLSIDPLEPMSLPQILKAVNEEIPKAVSLSTFKRTFLPMVKEGKVLKQGNGKNTSYLITKED